MGGDCAGERRAPTRVFQDQECVLVEWFWRPCVLGAGEGHADAERGRCAPQGALQPVPRAPTLHPWLVATLPCGRVCTSCAKTPAPRGQGVSWAPLEPQRVAGVCWGLNPEGGMSSKNTPRHPALLHMVGVVREEQLGPPACRAVSGLTFMDCVSGLQHAIRVRSAFSLRYLMIHAENVIKISR